MLLSYSISYHALAASAEAWHAIAAILYLITPWQHSARVGRSPNWLGAQPPSPSDRRKRLATVSGCPDRTRRLPVRRRIWPTARTVAVGLFGLHGFGEPGRNLAGDWNGGDNFHLDSTHQAGQVTSKERNTGGAVDSEETQPHKQGPLSGRRERSARAQEAGGSEGPLPAEQVGRAGEAPPGRTPAVGARRASAAGSEGPEAAAEGGRRWDASRPVLRASESLRRRGAVDNPLGRVRIADAPPGASGPGEGGGNTGDTAPRNLEEGQTSSGGPGGYPWSMWA